MKRPRPSNDFPRPGQGHRERLFISLLILLIGACSGCSTTANSSTAQREGLVGSSSPNGTQRVAAVHVFEIKPSTTEARGDLLIPATLSVEQTAVVLSPRESRIVELSGQEGERVQKGEALARLNDEDQRNQVRQTELEAGSLRVEEQQVEAMVKLNRSELDRELQLEKGGVSSKADVERAQYKLEQTQRQLDKARLATRNAQARIEAAKNELEKSTIRAPIAGVVAHRYITLGTSIAKNDKLFEISQLTPLELKFQLPQTENARLRPGQTLAFSAVGNDRILARARIRRIDPVANTTSNTFGYLADVVGRAGLIPGQAVNLRIPRPAGAQAFWIPRAAFPTGAELRAGSSGALFVAGGNRCASRLVEVSSIEGDQVEIVSGLAAGDRVILAPPADLKEGQEIEVEAG